MDPLEVMYAIAASGTDLVSWGSWGVSKTARSPFTVSLGMMFRDSQSDVQQRVSMDVMRTRVELLFDAPRRSLALRMPSVCSKPTAHGVWLLRGEGGRADVAVVMSARFRDDDQTQERLLRAHRHTFPRVKPAKFLHSNFRAQRAQGEHLRSNMSWMGAMYAMALGMLRELKEEQGLRFSRSGAVAMEVQGDVLSLRHLTTHAVPDSSAQSVRGGDGAMLNKMEQCACPKCLCTTGSM